MRWYRATDVIAEVNAAGLDPDAARWVDAQITPMLATLPRGRSTRLLRGLIAIAAPDLAREREQEARHRRHATVWPAGLADGACRELTATLDVTDAVALDATLGQLADLLRHDGDGDTLDQRRATALGILADPARAFQILQGQPAPSQRQATVVVHIPAPAPTTGWAVARVEGQGPVSRDTLAELFGSERVLVRPVIDLNTVPPVDSYEIPERMRQAVTWRTPVDAFPYGITASTRCDLDHTTPFDHGPDGPPGQTRTDNLAPLSRRVHRAKTARGWALTQHPGGWLEWTSPAGYHYATGPYGTLRQVRPAA